MLAFIAMVAMACSQPPQTPEIVIPSVTIISPKNGDILEAGKPIVVKWKATGMTSGSLIFLSVSNNGAGKREGEMVNIKTYKVNVLEEENTYTIPIDTSALSKDLFHNLRLTGSNFHVNLLSMIYVPGSHGEAYIGPGIQSDPFAIVATTAK